MRNASPRNWNAMRHDARLREAAYPDMRDPALAAAWHSLQLHWLRSVPGYREQVSAKLAQALNGDGRGCMECGGSLEPDRFTLGCKHCDDRKRKRAARDDVDRLGREVEGCG